MQGNTADGIKAQKREQIHPCAPVQGPGITVRGGGRLGGRCCDCALIDKLTEKHNS